MCRSVLLGRAGLGCANGVGGRIIGVRGVAQWTSGQHECEQECNAEERCHRAEYRRDRGPIRRGNGGLQLGWQRV
jgi:hypothetical protein